MAWDVLLWAVGLNLSLSVVRPGVGLNALAQSLAPTVRCQLRSLSLGCDQEERATENPHILESCVGVFLSSALCVASLPTHHTQAILN